jgi:RNA polymerase sigma-70 factor (ECF subfamily)
VLAGQGSSPDAAAALEQLCGTYWYPLYLYIRRRGYNPEDAQDLTQSFFAHMLQKDYFRVADPKRGKFRTFLLTALSRFLTDEWRYAHRFKRGGGQVMISIDALSAEKRYKLEPIDVFDGERLFDRRWATTLLECVLARLEQESESGRRPSNFKEFRPFLVSEPTKARYQEAAQRLGTSVTAMRMAVSRLRRRYRELLSEEILRTTKSAHEAEDEYRCLMKALSD